MDDAMTAIERDNMTAIERDNNTLKGVLPNNYAQEGLDKQRLGELIDLLGTTHIFL